MVSVTGMSVSSAVGGRLKPKLAMVELGLTKSSRNPCVAAPPLLEYVETLLGAVVASSELTK